MKYYSSKKIYSCCGQYIACDKDTKDKEVTCPRCGEVQKAPLKTPYIIIVTK